MAMNQKPPGGVGPFAAGAPVAPSSNPLHGYLGAHKNVFPQGFLSHGKPSPTANSPRASQGVVGADVAKNKKAGY